MQTDRKNALKLNMLGVAVATVLLTACGGGGGSDGNLSTPTPTTVSGKAVDFYLSGATVTFTACGNATATTDANGGFTVPAGCTTSPFTVTGGTDIGTGLAFTGVLKAPAPTGSTAIASPLTTLIASNPSIDLVKQLGLPAGANPLTTDPMTDKASLVAAEVVQTLVNQVTAALTAFAAKYGSTLTPQQAAAAASQALGGAIANNTGSTFSLTSVGNITSIISAAVTNANSAAPFTLPAGTTLAQAGSALATAQASAIAAQTSSVSSALANITIGSDPAATLAALKTAGLTSLIGSVSTGAPLTDYVQLGNVSFNGGSPTTLAAVQASTAAAPISLSGKALSDVRISMTGVGLYANKTVAVNTGFKYTVNGNTVNLTINNVQLTFGSTGALTAATVPVGSSYSYTLTGASTATATATNATADNLFSNGAVDLSINTFLTKLAGAAGSSVNVSAYAPIANVAISPTLTISPAANSTLVLGNSAGSAVSGSVTANVQ